MTLVGYAVLVGVPVISTAWVELLGFTEEQVGRVAGADRGSEYRRFHPCGRSWVQHGIHDVCNCSGFGNAGLRWHVPLVAENHTGAC